MFTSMWAKKPATTQQGDTEMAGASAGSNVGVQVPPSQPVDVEMDLIDFGSSTDEARRTNKDVRLEVQQKAQQQILASVVKDQLDKQESLVPVSKEEEELVEIKTGLPIPAPVVKQKSDKKKTEKKPSGKKAPEELEEEESSSLGKDFRRQLGPGEAYQEDGNCTHAISAARQLSDNGKLFNDELVHKDYRHMDAPRNFVRGSKNKTAHFKPQEIPCRSVVRVTSGPLNVVSVFGDIQDGVAYTADCHWLKTTFYMGAHLPAVVFRVTISRDVLKKTERVAWVYVFGTNLDTKQKEPIQIVNAGTPAFTEDVVRQRNLMDATKGLVHLARDKRLTKITLNLLGAAVPDIEGRENRIVVVGDFSSTDVDGWTAQAQQKDPALTPAQLFICHMVHVPSKVEVYLPIHGKKPAEALVEHQAFANYFTAAMWLTAGLGNFWWFRRQTDIPWLSPQMPFSLLEVPRFQVEAWPIQQLNELAALFLGIRFEGAWAASTVPPPPRTWAPMQLTPAWPGPHEAVFVLAMAVHKERMWQQTHIQALFDRHNDMTASFMQLTAKPGHYLVKVFTGMDKYELSLAMPAQRQHIKLITAATKLQFSGEVVAPFHELNEGPADFYAYVTGGRGTDMGSDPHRIIIEFPSDETTFARQNTAVQKLNQPHQNTRGYDVHNIFLGTAVAANNHTSSFMDSLPAEKRAIYVASLDDCPGLKLDDSQKAAAMGAITSTSGGLCIWGPPGTGKTRTLVAIIRGLIKSGKKVLVTGPTNSSVASLVEAFASYVSFDEHRNYWTHYKGSMLKGDGYGLARAEKEVGKLDIQQQYWMEMLAQMHQQNTAELEAVSFARRRYEFADALKNNAQHPQYAAWCQQYIALGAGEYVRRLTKEERDTAKELEQKIGALFLTNCKAVFATCSMSADSMLIDHFKPDVIIIDEAACATIPDALIPAMEFKNTAEVIILAGDPNQQPPVALSGSQNEAFALLETSLLSRQTELSRKCMQQQDVLPVYRLTWQYRMHPDLIEFVNEHIYKSQIQNGVLSPTPAGQPLRRTEIVKIGLEEFFSPVEGYTGFNRVRFRMAVNVTQGHSARFDQSHSLYNMAEVEAIIALLDDLLRFQFKIGDVTYSFDAKDFMIITPYTAQKEMMMRHLHDRKAFGIPHHESLHSIEVSTSINAQGREARICFVSLTSHDAKDVTLVRWIAQKAQLNVELTRGQCAHITFGAFTPWLQAIVDRHKHMSHSGQKTFVAFVKDVYEKGDLFDINELLKMVRSRKPVMRKDGQIPRRFDESHASISRLRARQQASAGTRLIKPEEQVAAKAFIDGNTLNDPAPDPNAAPVLGPLTFADPVTGAMRTIPAPPGLGGANFPALPPAGPPAPATGAPSAPATGAPSAPATGAPSAPAAGASPAPTTGAPQAPTTNAPPLQPPTAPGDDLMDQT